MSDVLTPQQTEQGWIVEMTPEMIRALRVAEGSKILLTTHEGGISAEILPPLSPKLKEVSQYLLKKNHELYEELKRLGD